VCRYSGNEQQEALYKGHEWGAGEGVVSEEQKRNNSFSGFQNDAEKRDVTRKELPFGHTYIIELIFY